MHDRVFKGLEPMCAPGSGIGLGELCPRDVTFWASAGQNHMLDMSANADTVTEVTCQIGGTKGAAKVPSYDSCALAPGSAVLTEIRSGRDTFGDETGNLWSKP